jgi:predicted PolB exonuclease-like 3'-5' exonuclease
LSHSCLLVVDTETVPDRDLLSAVYHCDKMPKAIHQKVVAIALLSVRIERLGDREQYIIEELKSAVSPKHGEAAMLQAFWKRLERDKPRIVTWNGRGFDIPVLLLRSMIHGVEGAHWHTAGDKWSGYRKRFEPEWHCDLMDVLSDYRATTSLGLQEAAVAIGLPGKIGASGAEVEALMHQGEGAIVQAYCEGDVQNLYGLYLRWAFLSGKVDAAGHDAAVRDLLGHLERGRDERPHFGEFLDRWRASTRPKPMFVGDAFPGG